MTVTALTLSHIRTAIVQAVRLVDKITPNVDSVKKHVHRLNELASYTDNSLFDSVNAKLDNETLKMMASFYFK
jgi:hypothetical protein